MNVALSVDAGACCAPWLTDSDPNNLMFWKPSFGVKKTTALEALYWVSSRITPRPTENARALVDEVQAMTP